MCLRKPIYSVNHIALRTYCNFHLSTYHVLWHRTHHYWFHKLANFVRLSFVPFMSKRANFDVIFGEFFRRTI